MISEAKLTVEQRSFLRELADVMRASKTKSYSYSASIYDGSKELLEILEAPNWETRENGNFVWKRRDFDGGAGSICVFLK